METLNGVTRLLLRVRLLQQRTPELVLLLRMDEHELPSSRRQVVVDHHLDPLAVPPEAEAEDAAVFFRMLLVPLLVLVIGNDLNGISKNKHKRQKEH